MKMKKSAFKALIKECLVEILAEGLGAEALSEAIKAKSKPVLAENTSLSDKHHQQKRNPVLDHIVQGANGNDVMKNILEDTIATTLPKFLDGEKQSLQDASGSPSAQKRPSNTEHVRAPLEEVFGSDQIDRWNSLVF